MKIKKISTLVFVGILLISSVGCKNTVKNPVIEEIKETEETELVSQDIVKESSLDFDSNIVLGKYSDFNDYMKSKGYKLNQINDNGLEYNSYKCMLDKDKNDSYIYIEENQNGINSINVNINESILNDDNLNTINTILEYYFDQEMIDDINNQINQSIDFKNENNQKAIININENIHISCYKENSLFFSISTILN